MKKLIVDVENTTIKLTEKYMDYSPYNPKNKLVSVGYAWLEDGKVGEIHYFFLYHKDLDLNLGVTKEYQRVAIIRFKRALEEAEVIIAHNAKYDVQWLLEAGFDVGNKKIEDTMIREYVMARGRTDFSLRLADTCKRYKVAEKGELFEKYPYMQISEMPIKEVEDYGRADIQACGELYLAQQIRLEQDSYRPLHKTIDMMNEFCSVLVMIERNGVKIDLDALKQVEKQFTDEAEQLKFDLNAFVRKVMGDTPINLDSPQQLSEVVYSRRIKKGEEDNWIKTFNIGRDERGKNLKRPRMSYTQYADHVKRMTEIVLKTRMEQCKDCCGKGFIQRIKKDGTNWKNTTQCKPCSGGGLIYFDTNEVAGFKMKPASIGFTTIGGFSTNKTFLDELIEQAENDGKTDAKEFLKKLQRLSALSSYLSNFVGGIDAFMQKHNNILHTSYNQCITATGRLSSTKPNLQNMPREGTFPIRRVFISRFEGGKIIEVDYAQLEFRAGVHLARDINGKRDILNGTDIHNATAKIITEAGQPISRQDAKSRSFKPMYGGTTGTDAERSYYRRFLTELYPDIGRWHKKLQEEALKHHMLTLETGRQLMFADVERAWHGGCTRATQVVNYPCQSFATGDLLPASLIRLNKEWKKQGLKSLFVLTTHDSVTVDCIPEEEEKVVLLLKNLGNLAYEEMKERYDIELFVPMGVEVKVGTDAMNMKKVI
jgi:DNA polymerase I-like protein with 3'-5' exonuclease and polymerase domains